MDIKKQIYEFLSSHPEYRTSMDSYKPDSAVLDSIRTSTEGLGIKIFCANWCQDCRVQLPKFLNILLALEDDKVDLEIIEVNKNKEDEKGKVKGMNVLAVPTFIFFRDGKEIGRIIEKPKDRMENDIAQIVS